MSLSIDALHLVLTTLLGVSSLLLLREYKLKRLQLLHPVPPPEPNPSISKMQQTLSELEKELEEARGWNERIVPVLVEERDRWNRLYHDVSASFDDTSRFYQDRINDLLAQVTQERARAEKERRLKENLARKEAIDAKALATPLTSPEKVH